MSKKYNKTFTNLKTVVSDTSILNAQKILVNTSSDNVTERTDIVDYIESSVDGLEDKVNLYISDIENEVQLLNDKTQEIDNIFYEKYDNYNTITFSLDIEKSQCDTSSFRLGYKHTPNGIIKKVSLYARNGGGTFDCNTNGCYLLVQRYNKATSELISSVISKNKVIVQKNSESTPLLNTWEFDGFESCKEGEILKFMPTSGDSPIANYQIGILVDPYHTHDDCNVGGDTFVDGVNTTPLGAGNKWVAYVQFEGDFYRESDFKTHHNESSKHLKSIERPIIESLYTTAKAEIWNNNINNAALGNASVKGFKLERPYISNCVFNEMRWTTTSGTENCTSYLKLTLNDVRGKALCSYFSNNTESFNATGLKSFRFDEDIEITDKIGSIVCEISLDGVNVVTTEGKRARLATVGTTTNNTTDGTEATNSNIIAHIIFYGNKPTSLLASHIGDDTHLTTAQKSTISDCTNSTYTTVSDESATASGEFDAVHFKYQDVPHDFPIKKFILKPVESKNTPLYMAVWTQAQSGQKTYVGLSDEAITWEAEKDAVWTFNNVELIVPENHNVEFFLCTGPDAVNEIDATAPGVYIKTKYDPNGRGSIRYSGGWGYTRCIQATFSNNGYLSHVNDDSHLTVAQKNAINDYLSHVGDNTHLTETDRELLDNLANGYVENLYTNSVNIVEDASVVSVSAPVTVTVDGITLDASVTAQNRMARVILVMEEDEIVQWLSSNGTLVTLTKSQLKQALKAAVSNEITNWI